jgi:AcrR family transcriptional regulator
MVHKSEARPRGRPRAFDPEIALGRAREAFWDEGFSGTSLDDLSARMGLNRPSLYAAFGDKEALYLKTLRAYLEDRRTLISTVLAAKRPLRETLQMLFSKMIDVFRAGDRGARGCYVVGTAATEAVGNKEVREILEMSVRQLDEAFGKAFSAARKRGELGRDAVPKALALMGTGLVHTLALRARAGQSRAALRAVADAALDLMFSSGARR